MSDYILLSLIVFSVSLIPGALVFMLALWVYDYLTFGTRPGTDDYKLVSRRANFAGGAILTAGAGLLLIFFFWSVTLLNNNQKVARVANQIKLEKFTAIDNCLAEKFGVRHFLFNTYYNIETGETGTISQRTFDTCKGAF